MYAVVELYNNTLRQVAEKDQVLLIDLAREMPRNSAYYYDYLHYTEAGAAEVAEIIYRDLRPFLAEQFAALHRINTPPQKKMAGKPRPYAWRATAPSQVLIAFPDFVPLLTAES